ncbi:hypothetical protein M406DRAFT_355854 [Cryphonectria parasitica EP155]|uniref:Cyclochlorotine biosynthesis protein O n=1 Tax=Cryphonectria parasitica (strain ATCC 38755 / EP155) TaxID=660469 RepID=A0A9P5CNB2_CRYP1|nr:uncharacterized protein M406DRAFT_355854 [Cryphonectria parasitica EP155]KAF3765274.1 hypothetical protein M406DRAFT_355854 [Cryphonectria parasitica EP155]
MSTMKMDTWLRKYRGMQALKTEDEDEDSLPLSFEKKQKTTWPWLPLACTLLLAASAVSFNMRWYRGISGDPIDLPPLQYTFTDHPEMRPFDQETSDIWLPWGRDHWWSMEWRDPSGAHLTQGIDMLHKLHCLVSIREEFTMMATDKNRRVFFNDKTAESITRRMHIKHCFDFIRGDILCGADATVEPLDPGYTRSDGLGVEHQCRNWDVVMKYAAANDYFPDQLKGLK